MRERSRRDVVLEAAKKLFRQKGYHGTTIRELAAESGMLSGSLYAHIKTKEDLLFEITDEVANHFLTGLQHILLLDAPADEKFKMALLSHIQIVEQHLDAATVFSHEWRALGPERRQVIQDKRDRYEAMWAQIFQDGVQSGAFYGHHLRFARVVTLSVANWLYQWYRPDGEKSAKEIAEELAEVLLQGVRRIHTTSIDASSNM